MKKSEPGAKVALSSAFRLLKLRDRSEKEIRDKLFKKKYTNRIIEEVIAHLKSLGYIDDKKFARAWANFRLKTPFGLKRIVLELRQKGIDEDIISDILSEVHKTDIEEAALIALAMKRLTIIRKREKNSFKVHQKLYQFLLRRGFSSSDIMRLLSEMS